MLIEAWHHVLKGKFLHGKRNRRLDQLLYVLVEEVIPYYAQKQWRQLHGFEGEDLEVKMRQKILKKAESIGKDTITELGNSSYSVQAQSDSSSTYNIDMDAFTCDCPSYPAIKFCQHIAAIQNHFSAENELIDLTSSSDDQGRLGLGDLKVTVNISNSQPVKNNTPKTPVDDTSTDPQDSLIASMWNHSVSKFHTLAGRLGASATSITHNDATVSALRLLNSVLDDLLKSTSEKPMGSVLPLPRRCIPPNISSKTETRRVLPIPQASKASRKVNTEPYCGGEKPGKLAKPDAKAGEKTVLSQPLPEPQAMTPEASTKSQPVSRSPVPNSTHLTPNITTAVATTAVTIQASTPQPTNTPQITNPRPPMQNNLKRPANYSYQSQAMATNMYYYHPVYPTYNGYYQPYYYYYPAGQMTTSHHQMKQSNSNDPNRNILPK
ncbi:hypothetical protein FRC02_011910 [Tulasnella sp. 418]|nr:hypothetical protein FRC02_011910 [Tulasnella sp. 418]